MNLQPFCATKPLGRPVLEKPFSFGAFTYATNGHILVRVARRADVPEVEGAPNPEKLITAYDSDTWSFSPPPIYKLPKLELTECDHCYGRGREHNCPQCACPCTECGGAPKVPRIEHTSVDLRGVPFAIRYVRQILALPGITIPDHVSPIVQMQFRFDGGVGLLMPLVSPSLEHIKPSKRPAPAKAGPPP